jgi:hypothetical protein
MASMLARRDDPRIVVAGIVVLCVASRAGLWLVGVASQVAAGQRVEWLGMWSRWDAPHYLRVAEAGYSRVGEDALYIVFLPIFPLAVKAAAFVVRDLVAAGLVVSLAAQVGSGWFLYRLACLDTDAEEARRAVLTLFCFPTAYYLAAPYTESLFLFGTLAAMYAARTQRWARSALAGALATGTRLAGVALLPALAVEAWRGAATTRLRWARLTCVGLAGSGLAIYLLINLLVFGDPLHFLGSQRQNWFQRAVPPWMPLVEAVLRLVRGGLSGDFVIIYTGRISAFVLAVVLLTAGARRLRLADQVYGWAGLVVVMSASWLISLPRYLLGMYPLFLVAGRLTRRRAVLAAWMSAGLGGQAWLFSRYATGAWTF